MTESPFTNPKHQPTKEEIKSALGSCFPLWEHLTSFIKKTYKLKGTWSTWGPAKTGWNLRYKRKGRSLVALHPLREQILVQVVLGKVEAERALQLKFGEKITMMLHDTPQLRDGRWLHIPLTSEADVKDVEKLLLTKMQPPKLEK